MKENRKLIYLAVVLILGALAINYFNFLPFAILPGAPTQVWVPAYGTVACEQTRLECWPKAATGLCGPSDIPTTATIPDSGATYTCGSPTMTPANYYEGCNFHLEVGAAPLGYAKVQRCDSNGYNCVDLTRTAGSFWANKEYWDINIPDGQKLFVDPQLWVTAQIWSRSPVYGLSIEGEGVKPQYASTCNFAQLLNDKQIATLRSDENYDEIVNAGILDPGRFPYAVITSYRYSYNDQRILSQEIDGKYWFVEDVGVRCAIEKDSAGYSIVTDNCINDNTIQCLPNIGNCDSTGKLKTDSGGDGKACVPGTLIGTTTNRVPISLTEACKTRCNAQGVPENFDCVAIQPCIGDKVLNANYECVDAITQTEQDRCVLKGGNWIETLDAQGRVVKTECRLQTIDTNLLLIIGAIGVAIIIATLVLTRRR